MSDIEILLKELSDKVDDLNNKVDGLTEEMKKIKGPTVTVWGDDSIPLGILRPQEIKCDTRKENKDE